MYLKKVHINGFKSFAEKTEVELHRGVTAVVGPNGCGKSNIVDAIRWVLGEQSAKALRGSTMQDTIFDGSEKRKPLSMSEVALLFSDCEDQLGTAFHEVEVKRRVSRDGSSDYYLNGKVCRLRDIQQLFMDTGIGRESYSFMAQGQISQIIDANPAGRRLIFEEAAGITRYKTQRKEALNKLARVDQNLESVTKILEEISRTMASVKRQASKTLRHKRLKHRLVHLDLAWNKYQYEQYQARLETTRTQAETLRKDVTSEQNDTAALEEKLQGTRQEDQEVAQNLSELQERIYGLRSAKEEAERQLEFARTRQEDANHRLHEVNQEIQELNQSSTHLQEKAQESEAQKEQQAANKSSSDERYQARQKELQQTQEQLEKRERELSEEKQRLLLLESSISRLRNNCTHLEVELKTAENKRGSLKDSISELEHNRAQQQQALSDTREGITRKEQALTEADKELEEARQSAEQLRQQYKEKQQEISEMDRALAKSTAQLNMLQDLQSRFEGFSEGAKAILQGKLKEEIGQASTTALSQQIDVEDPYAPQTELLLSSAADAITFPTYELLPRVAASLKEQKLGRAALHFPTPSKDSTAGDTFPSWLVPASKVIRSKDASLQPHIESLLKGCFFCDTVDNFLEFWNQNPNFPFFMVVTGEEEIIDARGLVFAGSLKKKGQQSSLIQRQSEIKRLTTEVKATDEKLTLLNDETQAIQQNLETAEQEIEQKRENYNERKLELSNAQSEEKSSAQTLQKTEQQLERTQKELDELLNSHEQAQQKLRSATDELAQTEHKIQEHKDQIQSLETQQQQLRQQRDEKQERLNNVRLERAEKQKALEIIDANLKDLHQQKEERDHRIEKLRQEKDHLHEQFQNFEAQQEQEKEKATQSEETLGISNQKLQERNERHQTLQKTIQETETQLGNKRAELRKKENRLNELDVALAREQSQSHFIVEKVESEYEQDIEEIDWKRSLWDAEETFETKLKLEELEDPQDLDTPKPKTDRGEPTADDLQAMEQTDWEPLKEEIKKLKSKIASMGEINPAAIEEYTEQKERYDFLKNQSDDLWQSKNELLQAIDEINQTSQQLFEETFEQVRKNFAFCYEKLNGGKADLKLVEAEDVLESGIEIMAQPMGTNLKNLSLLSGGQKTMTAVSLLFAIYMVKPSPFCVLDELDAPLDDANINRFIDMLRSFLEYSQFLVITHNKRTLHAASTIYGVTMQEAGVTKLISMRFNTQGEAVMENELAEPVSIQ